MSIRKTLETINRTYPALRATYDHAVGEYRVAVRWLSHKGTNEASAYYTDDAADAIATASRMCEGLWSGPEWHRQRRY